MAAVGTAAGTNTAENPAFEVEAQDGGSLGNPDRIGDLIRSVVGQLAEQGCNVRQSLRLSSMPAPA